MSILGKRLKVESETQPKPNFKSDSDKDGCFYPHFHIPTSRVTPCTRPITTEYEGFYAKLSTALFGCFPLVLRSQLIEVYEHEEKEKVERNPYAGITNSSVQKLHIQSEGATNCRKES